MKVVRDIVNRVPNQGQKATDCADYADAGKVSQKVNESAGQGLNHGVGNAFGKSSSVLSAKSVQSADYRISFPLFASVQSQLETRTPNPEPPKANRSNLINPNQP